jgi:hypothetical protein
MTASIAARQMAQRRTGRDRKKRESVIENPIPGSRGIDTCPPV